LKEVNAGASLSLKLSLPQNQYENADYGYYAGFKETVPDELTEEECNEVALTMIERARKLLEDKIDEDLHKHRDVKIFSKL
jgi:hypothetical protein